MKIFKRQLSILKRCFNILWDIGYIAISCLMKKEKKKSD
uniref:Uncharacterized protein n=1 Tax=Siphoviridae sp. ctnNB1 TaxID=2825660 RepID=A0A8S5UVH5_9CAUD|nr:MAG TPA: hypothetical protein [Siphoviridae sp. ctnNB1]